MHLELCLAYTQYSIKVSQLQHDGDVGNNKEKEIVAVGIVLGIFYKLNSFDLRKQHSEALTIIIPHFPQKELGHMEVK